MPNKATLSALRALRDEFAARSALGKAADAADATKYTRDIEPRAPFTPEQMREGMRRQALANAPEQKMLQGFYRGFAGDGGAAPDVFVTPQKRVADYYAQKRAGQTGQEPHAEMVLADPFAGRAYGHSTPGSGATEPMFTRARKVKESDVVDRTQLYADGGAVTDDHTQPDMADGGRLIGDPNLYAGGGLVKSALGALADVLPRAKAEKNLDKFLAKSAVKQPVYHGTNIPEAIAESQQFAHPQPGKSGIHWFSESPKLADKYTSKYWEDYGDQGAIFPMHMQAKKPLELPFNMNDRASKEFKRYVREGMGVYPEVIADAAALNSDQKLTKVWHFVNSPEFREAAMRKGYDSLRAMEGKTLTWGAFSPEQVKSVFNRGTYDTKTPDIGKAQGGLVAAFKDGGSTDAAFGVFPQMKPRRAGKSNIGEELYKAAFIPQDMLDVALMAAPYGKLGKLAAAGAAALSPMEAEAGKVKTGLDLGRRALFGLKPSQEMAGRELVRKAEPTLDEMRAALNRAERAAPKVEERSVTIDPGKGSAKVTDVVQKVAETPVSRRTVLKTAAGQVMQNALPASSFADLMKPATVAKQAVQAMAPAASATPFGMPGLIAAGLREGMREEDVARMILDTYGRKGVTPQKVESAVSSIKDPSSVSFEEPVGAGRAMMELMGTEGSPMANRGALRYMRKVVPEKYDELRQTAKDIAEYGFEP